MKTLLRFGSFENDFKEIVYSFIHYRWFSIFIYALIISNIVALILETDPKISSTYTSWFLLLEYASITIFSLEYLIRVWVADIDMSLKPLFGSRRLGYIFSFYGIVDLLAITPFYLSFMAIQDLRILRGLRLLRLLRILKLGRYSSSLRLIFAVLKETKPQLIMTFFVAALFLIVSATLMYYVEHAVQPDKFSSIGDALWWSIATLTTVGYGDVYPITGIGRFLSSIIALIGIGFIALPTGILSSAFILKIQRSENGPDYCPDCRKKITNQHS